MRHRPGPGWTSYNPAVWENRHGTRIHVQGLIRSPDGNIVHVSTDQLFRYMRITGGNRKRALMAIVTDAEQLRLNNT